VSTTVPQGAVTISYSGGRVTSSAGSRLQVSRGQTVRLVVTSDVAEEVHVHGYDRRGEVAPGQTVTVTFTADIAGIFEVELEKSHKLLLRLEVR
jgi:heme/copper-type cytochrome/quinol oxidase subunit 2